MQNMNRLEETTQNKIEKNKNVKTTLELIIEVKIHQ